MYNGLNDAIIFQIRICGFGFEPPDLDLDLIIFKRGGFGFGFELFWKGGFGFGFEC